MTEDSSLQPPLPWTAWLLQSGHRLGIVATLLVAGYVGTIFKQQPLDMLAWIAIGLADVAIVVSACMLFSAYRAARPVRQTVGILLFALIIAHAAGYLLLTHYDVVNKLIEFAKSLPAAGTAASSGKS